MCVWVGGVVQESKLSAIQIKLCNISLFALVSRDLHGIEEYGTNRKTLT